MLPSTSTAGSISFNAAATQAAASSGVPVGIVVGDFNNDGDADVVTPASTSNDAQLFRGD